MKNLHASVLNFKRRIMCKITKDVRIKIQILKSLSSWGPREQLELALTSSFLDLFFFSKFPIWHHNLVSFLNWLFHQFWALMVLTATWKDHFIPICIFITKLILVKVSKHFQKETIDIFALFIIFWIYWPYFNK
jgi:hypothetical protein